jgi:hypothetical protein
MIPQHLEPSLQSRLHVSSKQLVHRQRVPDVQVGGIGGRTVAQRPHVRMRRHDMAERQQGPKTLHCCVVRVQLLEALELRPRTFQVAFQSAQLGDLRLQRDVFRVFRQSAIQQRSRLCEGAGRLERMSAFERAVGQLGQMPVQHPADLRFGRQADEMVDGRAILEEHDGGETAYADLLRQLRLLIRVHLGEAEAAAVLLDQVVENGLELAARPAPRRPEIHQHGCGGRRLEDIGHEAAGGHGQGMRIVRHRICLAATRCVMGNAAADHGVAGEEIQAGDAV